MTIDGQLPLIYFFPGKDGVIPIPSTEEDVVTQAENYFKNRINSLPTDQRARFLARIREMAGQILGRIQEMRQYGSSADLIRSESERLFNQLKSTGDNFLAETERNAKASAEQNRRFDNFDQRLQNMKLELNNFVAPPPKKARDFKDMLQTAKKAHAVDMEAKKTQIAQCIQMEDPSVPGTAGFCIAQQLNGLSKDEQRELLNFVPNAVVGNAINQIAAVPVVVSKVISTVTNLAVKAVVKGAIAEAAIEAPHLREHLMEVDKALDGKNPEFNARVKQVVQDVKKAAPNWMKTAGRTLTEYNNQLSEFDQKLHRKYRTIPGIIHEGVVGSVEVATMFVPIPLAKGAVTAVKRVATPLKGMIQTSEEMVGSGLVRATSYHHYNHSGRIKLAIAQQNLPSHSDVYFHSTSFDNAKTILSSGKIKRMDEGDFKGAFVSSKPELQYGNIVFVFNRQIETVSPALNAAFEQGAHWVGFSKSIPVNNSTLEYVAVNTEKLGNMTLKQVQEELSNIVGREITVVPAKPIVKLMKHRTKQEGVFVPENWPKEMLHECE